MSAHAVAQQDRGPVTANGHGGEPAPPVGLEGPARGSADPLEPLGQLFRDLRSSPTGLSEREAARRLEVSGRPAGDPTELALLELAAGCGLDVSLASRAARRRTLFRFDPRLKLMTTVDERDGGLVVNTKGAPEEVLARATRIRRSEGEPPITAADRDEVSHAMRDYARQGLRVLAVAHRMLPVGAAAPVRREDAERELTLIGLLAMLDPPRPEVPAAIKRVHQAGIRVHVVTGDNGLTAAAIARRVGIGADGMRVINGTELDAMSEPQLDDLLSSGRRSSSRTAPPRPSSASPTHCGRRARSSR